MGNGVSLQLFDPSHVRIYRNLLGIQSASTRAEMIQTLLAGPEQTNSARRAGIYAHLLAQVARAQKGEPTILLPGEENLPPITQMSHVTMPPPPPQVQQRGVQLTPASRPTGVAMVTQTQNAVVGNSPTSASAHIAKGRRNEKALTQFQSCLLVLGLEEEVALTETELKKAQKKAAIKAHPDKGGTEQEFEAITRAQAYLTEILRRIQGGRGKEGVVEAPSALRNSREEDSKNQKHVEPVRLNPKKLDLNAFNQMFEQTRMPDPDDEGQGDWLKTGETGSQGKKFSGGFNRDVFNQMFEDESRRAAATPQNQIISLQPSALTLAPSQGVELGRGAVEDQTAAANDKMRYTDLKAAQTRENTFSGQVASVRVEARNLEQQSAARKKAPEPMSHAEAEAVAAAEKALADRERARALRAAQEDSMAASQFERMKRLVLTDSPHS